MEDNKRKLYDALSQEYDLGSFEQFSADIADDTKRRKLYDATSEEYDYGDYDSFSKQLGFGVDLSRPTPGTERLEQPARTVDPQAAAEGRSLFNQMTAARRGTSSLSDAPQATQQYIAQNPVQGGSREREQLLEQLGATGEEQNFIHEYDRRYAKYLQDTDNELTGPDQQAEKAWLDENNQRYREAKQKVGEIQGRINLMDKPEDLERIAGKRKDIQEKYPALFNPGGYRPDPSKRLDPRDPEIPMYKSANEIYGMAEQALNQGSKYDPGYEGNALEQLWTASRQFVEDGINNFDNGSLTFGLSEGMALTQARNVGDKSNGIVNATLKDMNITDEDVNNILKSIDENGTALKSLVEELKVSSAEIDNMRVTLEDMQKRGAPESKIRSYTKQYNQKIKEYNTRIKNEVDPLEASYVQSYKQYETIMSAVDAALEKGLTDGEKALLDALEEFTDAKMKRAEDVSVASAAGAGAEQSAEFMLDFVLTGGLAKAGTKAATKLTTKRVLKKFGAEAAAKVVRSSIGAQIATDAVVAAARTTVMFPRNLAAYGEQLTQMTGKDNLGRYNFDRSHLNAALNTALTQYIEYWSEGFGEYFGAGEQALFRNVTKAAPRTAIGKTLGQYRGSIGKYLDYGKFDGMFNEMLEEVVGSSLNSLAGWMSGDRVGDQEALKEFFSGEQLATLALSFLPMSAISASTNIRAYNKMKNRYNASVAELNPFLDSGAISREELEGLVSNIAEKTPEEIKDSIVSIADKARAANGGSLPQNFTQSLLGYVEGSFAMSMNNEAWEDSQEKLGVVNAYTEQYSNPDERNAYDLAQLESEARAAAMQAGFDENMLDLDPYSIARHAQAIRETTPQQAQALLGYAAAKAAQQGLKDGYDEETKAIFNGFESDVRANLDVNGSVITATLPNGRTVYIDSKDERVTPDGKITTPTGNNGLVSFRYGSASAPEMAKADTFSNAKARLIDDFILFQEYDYTDKRTRAFEQAQNTISTAGMARALNANIGNTVFFRSNGIYEPMQVQRLTQNGSNVVVSGDPKFLNGLATMLGLQSPGGQSMELPIETIWPMLDTNDDGSLATNQPEVQPATTSAQPAATPSQPASEPEVVIPILIPDKHLGEDVEVVLDGNRRTVTILDVSGGNVYYEFEDENGDTQTRYLPYDDFMNAQDAAANPRTAATPATPAEQPQAPAGEETPAAPEAGFKETRDYYKPGATVDDVYTMLGDLYGNEDLLAEEVDEEIQNEYKRAEKAHKNAQQALDDANPEKIERQQGESLPTLAARRRAARENYEKVREGLEQKLQDAESELAFWEEAKKVVDADIQERKAAVKEEAERQKRIEQYGIDTREWEKETEPRSLDEAIADALNGFFNGGGFLNYQDVVDVTGLDERSLLRQGWKFVLRKDGISIDDFVHNILAGDPQTAGFVKDEQEAINKVGELLQTMSRGELGKLIFNNRLKEAIAAKEYADGALELEQQNGASEEYGPFGQIFRQFVGNAKEAINHLMKVKSGEAIGALSHPEIGPIDLVWGDAGTSNSDGYGLAKLVKFHPEAVENLQEILNDMSIVKRSDNRIHLESEKYKAVVRLTWDAKRKTWLLTAFEKKNSALDNTTDTGETNDGKRNDTATPQDTVSSGDKGSNNSETNNAKTSVVPTRPASGNQPAETDEATPSGEQSGTQSDASGNTTSTQQGVSTGKDTDNSEENNTPEDIPASEAVEEAPEGTAVPEVEEPVDEPAEPVAPAPEEKRRNRLDELQKRVSIVQQHPNNLRAAYESGDAERISSAEKAMSDFINSSDSILLLRGTENVAKDRRKKADKGSAEHKLQDFILKAIKRRIGQLDKAAVKAFDNARAVYEERFTAEKEALESAIAYFQGELETAQELLNNVPEGTNELYVANLKNRVSSAKRYLDVLTQELNRFKEEEKEKEPRVKNELEAEVKEPEKPAEKPAQKAAKASTDEKIEDFGEKNLADEIFKETEASLPEKYKGRLSVRESSTGDESQENFVQSYDLDGRPSGVTRIDLFDAKPTENPTWFAIDGSDVDAPREKQDRWEELAKIYQSEHSDIKMTVLDELGVGFRHIGDALSFVEWAREQESNHDKGKSVNREAKDGKIEDFGEKIGGARKDTYREKIRDSVKMTSTDLKKLKDPDKILPRKKIISLMEEGAMSKEDGLTLLSLNMAVRSLSDTLGMKTLGLMKYRDLASAWEKGNPLKMEITDADIDFLIEQKSDRVKALPNIREKERNSLEVLLQRVYNDYRATYEALNYPTVNRALKSAYIRYGSADGRYWVVGSPSSYRGWPFPTMEQAVAKMKAEYPEIKDTENNSGETNKGSEDKIGNLLITKDDLGYYRIKSRSIPGKIYLSKKFYNKKEAEQFLKDNAASLVDREQRMVDALLGSNIGMVQREGRDYRNGADVTPDQMLETFGFRGVEFGNWVPQAERQEYLNKTYDAIMDFCDIVGISPKAFSLGGRLGLAFGARGHSHALAHYEPMKEVINLTRMKGAGSLAHEWFHALDNYLAKQKTGNTSDMATDTKNVVREEMEQAFRDFVGAMNQLDYSKRSRRAGDYWGEVWERAARLFESYVYNELASKSVVSPLLVSKDTLFDDVQSEDNSASSWPYPSIAENEQMKPFFDKLFETIEEKVDENGVIVLATDRGRYVIPESEVPYYYEYQERLNDAGDNAIERAKVLQEYYNRVQSDDYHIDVVPVSQAEEYLRNQGLSEEELKQALGYIGWGSGINLGNHAVIFADASRMPSIAFAWSAYVHERQHMDTANNPTTVPAVREAYGNTEAVDDGYARMKQTLARFGASYKYFTMPAESLASEIMSRAIEVAYGEENFADILKNEYLVPDKVIQLVKDSYEQRNSFQRADNTGQEANVDGSQSGRGKENGRNGQEVSGQDSAGTPGRNGEREEGRAEVVLPTDYSSTPFFSNAEKAVESVKSDKATPLQWLAQLEKNGGLKAGEDKWIGLSDWLKASDKKTLTKQEVLDYIRKNEILVADVKYSEKAVDYLDESWWGLLDAKYPGLGDVVDFYPGDGGGTATGFIDTYGVASAYNKAHPEEEPIAIGEDAGFTRGEMVKMKKWVDGIAEGIDSELLEKYPIDSNKINETRLGYTTNGLDNKREIALVVPTIEPWNETDDVHFGDAGNGRAVAWARFGDAKVADVASRDAAKKAKDEAYEAFHAYRRKLFDKYNVSTYSELLSNVNEEERKELYRLSNEWNERDRALEKVGQGSGKVLFIDEIQSARHQEGREKGHVPQVILDRYRELVAAKDNAIKAHEDAKNEMDDYFDSIFGEH
ncbi:MAG: hypothetical protein IJU69_07265, partial [Bacteroidales bacterium]|nr:hypothetical protein [Bacteroidales bacterium]